METDSDLSGWTDMMGKDLRTKVIKEGDGPYIDVDMYVRCSYRMFTEPNGELIESLVDEKFMIGEGDTIPGLELCIRHSRVGSVIQILCASKFAFYSGRPSLGSIPAIPIDTMLRFEVEVQEILTPSSDPSLAELSYVTGRKEAGNRWYKYHEYMKAAKCYSKAIERVETYLSNEPNDTHTHTDTQSDTQLKSRMRFHHILIDSLNNLAACHIILHEYYKAKTVCLRLLEYDANNVKGLLRAAKASLSLADYDDAELCLTRLLSIDPTSDLAKKELARLRKAQKEYKLKSTQMAKTMAKSLFSEVLNTVPKISDTVQSSTVDGTDMRDDQNENTRKKDNNALKTKSNERKEEREREKSNTFRLSRVHPTLLLTAASLLVLFVSILVAYIVHG
mmetsp:Transcript_20366/g.20492  ORF Transcript_20366/g.20492 Transcript_20366/m.20492 type:complete len:392 (+) Transcript_20366:315-1490(+)